MPLQDLTVLHAGHVPDCRARIDRYFTGYYSLQFMAWGGVEVYFEEERHDLTGSWLWCANTGPRMRYWPGNGFDSWEHRYVGFQGPLATQWLADGLLLDRPQPCPDVAGFIKRFDQLITCSMKLDRISSMRARNLLEGLLIDLAAQRDASLTESDDKKWMEVVTDRILRSLADEPDYNQIASSVGMGLSTLRRKFKQSVGMSVHTFTIVSRVSAAKRLLAETDLPIKAIAEQTGYSDVYFFTRQFKEIAGATPAVYRRSRQ